MARICGICSKRPQVGMHVSHARNRVKRWLYPNVHTMRYTISSDNSGKVKRGKVCTKCVKAGKIKKII